jgi:hypothetical protein
MIKGNKRFTAPKCRGGCVSRKFLGACYLSAVAAGGDFNAQKEDVKTVTHTDETCSVHDGQGWGCPIDRPETTKYVPEMIVCVSPNPRDIARLLDYTV